MDGRGQKFTLNLLGSRGGKKVLRRSRRRWKNNTKMDLKEPDEMVWCGVARLVQDRDE
jgi:hypothetical protein